MKVPMTLENHDLDELIALISHNVPEHLVVEELERRFREMSAVSERWRQVALAGRKYYDSSEAFWSCSCKGWKCTHRAPMDRDFDAWQTLIESARAHDLAAIDNTGGA